MKPSRETSGRGHERTEKFWMCLVDGSGGCAQRHYDYEEARAEVERLARKEGKGVTLLEATDYCRPTVSPVEWLDID
jgi:hypothetical protein